MIRLELWFWGMNTIEVKWPHLLILGVHDSNLGGVNLDHLVKVVFARFLHCKLKLSSPFHILFFGYESLKSSPHFWRGKYLQYIIWSSSLWNNCPFSHLFIQSFISVWTHAYLFHTLEGNPIPHYFCCSNFSSFGDWKHFQVGSCIPLTCPIVLIFEHFLL